MTAFLRGVALQLRSIRKPASAGFFLLALERREQFLDDIDDSRFLCAHNVHRAFTGPNVTWR